MRVLTGSPKDACNADLVSCKELCRVGVQQQRFARSCHIVHKCAGCITDLCGGSSNGYTGGCITLVLTDTYLFDKEQHKSSRH